MLDFKALAPHVRDVLVADVASRGHHVPLTAAEIFERLPIRDALLAECARKTDAGDAYELATNLVAETLIRTLGSEIRFNVIEGSVMAVDMGDSGVVRAPSGLVSVFWLGETALSGNRF